MCVVCVELDVEHSCKGTQCACAVRSTDLPTHLRRSILDHVAPEEEPLEAVVRL